MLRSLHLALALAVLPLAAAAQTPRLALGAGGSSTDDGRAVAADGAGGAFLAGSFRGDADFDGDGTPDLTASGTNDAYLARYDADGGLVFAVGFGGADGDVAYGAAPDGAGGAFVTGTFSGAADFDGDGAPDLTSAGSSDAFLARYDADGDLVFAVQAGGSSADEARGIAPDGAGGALVTGYFSASADFDADGTADLTSAGANDAFVARYDADGDLVFAVGAGSSATDRATGVAPDGAGGAFVTGAFSGAADFDGDGAPDLTSAGSSDAFVARYDADGDLVFATRAGGTGNDGGGGVAPDGAGGVFATGAFTSSADFDDDGTDDLTSFGARDAFLARYDASGTFVSAVAFGGPGTSFDLGADVVPDGAGGALVTGSFLGDGDFDGDGSPDVSGAGSTDAFLARYDAALDLVFVVRLGGFSTDDGFDLASDGAGGALLAGSYQAQADVDGDGTVDLTSNGGRDAFLAVYDGVAVTAEAGGETPALALAAWPTPAASAVNVQLQVPTAGEAYIAVYDVLGRRLAVVHDGPAAAGPLTLHLDASTLPAGAYLVRAVTADGAAVRRIQIVR